MNRLAETGLVSCLSGGDVLAATRFIFRLMLTLTGFGERGGDGGFFDGGVWERGLELDRLRFGEAVAAELEGGQLAQLAEGRGILDGVCRDVELSQARKFAEGPNVADLVVFDVQGLEILEGHERREVFD